MATVLLEGQGAAPAFDLSSPGYEARLPAPLPHLAWRVELPEESPLERSPRPQAGFHGLEGGREVGVPPRPLGAKLLDDQGLAQQGGVCGVGWAGGWCMQCVCSGGGSRHADAAGMAGRWHSCQACHAEGAALGTVCLQLHMLQMELPSSECSTPACLASTPAHPHP